MDSDIFRRLDALNSNERLEDSSSHAYPTRYDRSSTATHRFSYQPSFAKTDKTHAESELSRDGPLHLDEFDRQLLRQHEQYSHDGQHPLQNDSRHRLSDHAFQQHSTSPLPSSPLADAYTRLQLSSTRSSHLARPDVYQSNGWSTTDTYQAPRRQESTYGHSSTPIVHGITLVSTRELPDRFRSIFTFPLFNAVQSRSFAVAYQSNDNYVLSAPTGSGKTAILELAICRLVNELKGGMFKVVYQAPIKALCSERMRDWQRKFGPLDLQCAELTGDTEASELNSVKNASIIITTPEKWDSITRKWKDHKKLMELVKLFLIDEVHILKDERGATLEAVVSRMKSVATGVRFIALSATVPNAHDIAVWLGKNSQESYLPAVHEHFGEEFRPVRLARHVCGYKMHCNDFQLDNTLTSKIIADVIPKWSQRKPILIFCFTKKSCQQTAKALADWWSESQPNKRFWDAPRSQIVVTNPKLREVLARGVAFHSTDLSPDDRHQVETAYLERHISVICSTSTLAVGVNLPCHMVIVKGTACWQSGGTKPYSDLEIMQMLGRAGRPQFEQTAVSVIMTRFNQIEHYENIISGKELIESCLHDNLVEHMNAEIGLGTITDTQSAKRWLTGTFLYVRMKANPGHYKLDDDSPGDTLDNRLGNVCGRAVTALEEYDIVQSSPRLCCTEFGEAMTKYFVRFETMKTFLSLPHAAKTSEILTCIAQASEFQDIRFKAGEKQIYKKLNTDSSIKFRIPVNVDSTWHKVSLIIQSVLGMIDLPDPENTCRSEFVTAKGQIFQRIHRLVRCIVDCKLFSGDSTSVRNALMLARSFGAQAWDDSVLHLRQLPGVGPVTIRKLAGAGIQCVEDIDNADTSRLELIATRNPPFGMDLQKAARAFPRLRVSLHMNTRGYRKTEGGVTISVKAEVAFLNDKVPLFFNRKPVFVYLLAETSDGRKAHFAKIGAKQFSPIQEVLFTATLTDAQHMVRVYAMCEDVAGSCIHAQLKPSIPQAEFPVAPRPTSKPSKKGVVDGDAPRSAEDDFDDDLNDDDLAKAAEDVEFIDIDEIIPTVSSKTGTAPKEFHTKPAAEPVRLPSGKWACAHQCKDKTKCKHLCCREGLDSKPKPRKKNAAVDAGPKQTQLSSMAVATKAALPTPSTSLRHKDARNHANPGSTRSQTVCTPSASTLGKRKLDTPVSLPNRSKMASGKSTIDRLLPHSRKKTESWEHDSSDDLEMMSPPQWKRPSKQKNREEDRLNFSDELLEESRPAFRHDEVLTDDFDDFRTDDIDKVNVVRAAPIRSTGPVTSRPPLAERSANATNGPSVSTGSTYGKASDPVMIDVDDDDDMLEEKGVEQSVDPLRAWFEREFGTENFNYIG